MLFNSPEFLLFLPVTWIAYRVLLERNLLGIGIGFLVVASLFYYAWWNPPYLILLVGSILLNFFLGNRIARKKSKSNLILGISFNLGLLVWYKYSGFIIKNIAPHSIYVGSFTNLVLPLGISFFTFQQIAYLIDTYKEGKAEESLQSYTLFVSFFPQLIAGPIVHHKQVLPQFRQHDETTLKASDLSIGSAIFLIGLFKKIILADAMAELANPVFAAAFDGAKLTITDCWFGAIAYTFQLYFDFSGYSDMAVGCGRLFGIHLPINFASPYKATNIVQFWRRWHITLSQFLRDYLYIPLGGNRKGKFFRYANLMITMGLGGLWHGAGWNFLLWGLLHGFYLCVNHAFRAIFPTSARPGVIRISLSWLVTFTAVVVGWVSFRANTADTALLMLKTMLGLNGISLNTTVVLRESKLLASYFGIILLLPNTYEMFSQFNPYQQYFKLRHRLYSVLLWKPNRLVGAICGILAFLLTKKLLAAAESPFLYYNF